MLQWVRMHEQFLKIAYMRETQTEIESSYTLLLVIIKGAAKEIIQGFSKL